MALWTLLVLGTSGPVGISKKPEHLLQNMFPPVRDQERMI